MSKILGAEPRAFDAEIVGIVLEGVGGADGRDDTGAELGAGDGDDGKVTGAGGRSVLPMLIYCPLFL